MDEKEKAFLHHEVEEIKKHKWIESEKVGRDLGCQAVIDWVAKYAKKTREEWDSSNCSQPVQ